MKFAINIPNFAAFGDARVLADLAHEAEEQGWDGFFIWDHMQVRENDLGDVPIADPWVGLAAMAMATQRIRIAALVTPLPRRRPWKVAREIATLDQLSGGRLIFGAGIGGNWWGEYATFGEDTSEKVHGEKLDEALAIVSGLWSGEPFSFSGQHYTIQETRFLPTPAQKPRIPIWIAAGWPHKKPLRRAAHWDGVCPISEGEITADNVREMLAIIHEERTSDAPFDVVLAGFTGAMPAAAAQALLGGYRDAGVTWWQDGFWGTDTAEQVRDRIRKGPPQLE